MPNSRISHTSALYVAALVVLSAIYYSAYVGSGFNYADDGNYAQVCYELLMGRDIHDIVLSYGATWFKFGEGLFRLFGVHFIAVRALFFVCLTLTTLLVYAAIAMGTGSKNVALLMASVILLVPPFPATAFYGLGVMINVAAQMRLATRLLHPGRWDATLAGAALAGSFLLRPDFGYAFTLPLLALIFLAPRTQWRFLVLNAVLGFAAVQALAFLGGLAGGYADVLMRQYLEYPALLTGYVVGGFYRIMGQEQATVAATVLGRPGRHALLRGDTAGLALLIYFPVLVVAAFTIITIAAWFRKQRTVIPVFLVALFAAIATLPHYFFFRPDLSHVANFMPGYVVLAAVIITAAIHLYATPNRVKRIAAAVVAGALMGHLGVYLGLGLNSDATGAIGTSGERTETFESVNGVDARVTAAEKTHLAALQDAVVNHSQPGDNIICYPYCPGVAFMTGRRLLLHNFFADDGTPLREPGWIDMAIARTRAAKPPVVIIMDWAVNGTDRSRFDVWAAPYVAALKEMARDQVVMPGITIYFL